MQSFCGEDYRVDIIDIGYGRFLDMTFTPMMTNERSKGAQWVNDYVYDYKLADAIVDMVTEYDAVMKTFTAH